MAQVQSNINIAAPGFAGVNTQRSPTTLGPEFAAIADNCIIDRYGRVGSRKGFEIETENAGVLGGNPLETIHYHTNNIIFSAGNGKVWEGTDTLVDVTPAGAAISTDAWTIVSFNQRCYFYAIGNDPLVYDDDSAQLTKLVDHPNFSGTAPAGQVAVGAFGRMWVAEGDLIRWSDTLNGTAWAGGSVGSLDMNLVWPNGYDEITAIAEHNNFLVIFGRKSVVLYEGASDPATMQLADTISGMGAVGRFCVASTGADLMFIDYSGLRSLGRTIQEKSVPIGDVSANVRSDIKEIINTETINGEPRLLFVDSESFLLASFSTQSILYCFDMRGFLEDGSARTTVWPATQAFDGTVDPFTGILYVSGFYGVSIHTGYTDGPNSIPFRYYSNPMEFGKPVNLKFLKQVDVTAIGGSGVGMTLAWAYDYSSSFNKKAVVLSSGFIAEFGVSEYNEPESEYSSGNLLETEKYNTNGSGVNVTVGIEAEINGSPFSIQALNFQALIGRIM